MTCFEKAGRLPFYYGRGLLEMSTWIVQNTDLAAHASTETRCKKYWNVYILLLLIGRRRSVDC